MIVPLTLSVICFDFPLVFSIRSLKMQAIFIDVCISIDTVLGETFPHEALSIALGV